MDKRSGLFRLWRWLAVSLMLFCLIPAPAWGQSNDLSLSVSPSGPGVDGFYRLGTWVPLRVTIENHLPQPRRVMVQWSAPDADGDRVLYRRSVTLSPNRRQTVWLYAHLVTPPPSSSAHLRSDRRQEVAVYPLAGSSDSASNPDGGLTSSASGESVRQIVPPGTADGAGIGGVGVGGIGGGGDSARTVGILGSPDMGLSAYIEPWAQQQGCTLIRGLTLDSLPDRADGLAMFQTLILTPSAFSSDVAGGDVGGEGVGAVGEAGGLGGGAAGGGGGYQAIGPWVDAGGHLVIVLPSLGYQACFESPLRDRLPVTLRQVHRQENLTADQLPSWLGVPNRYDKSLKLSSLWFDVQGPVHQRPSVLLRDRNNRPAVIAQSVGLGRVTLIGLDLTDVNLRRLGLPSSLTQAADPVGMTLWPTVLGWRGPVFSQAFLEAQKGKMIREVNYRRRHDLSTQAIEPWTTMQQTVATVMMLAILVMAAYWILSGPVLHWVTKAKKIPHHNWLVFLGVIAVFSLIAWGGAWLLLPGQSQSTCLVTIDGDAVSQRSRVHAWGAIYVPQHTRLTLTASDLVSASAGESDKSNSPMVKPSGGGVREGGIGGEFRGGGVNGFQVSGLADASGFIDSQEYARDMLRRDRWSPPMRSTAKPFEVDFQTTTAPAGSTGRAAWRSLPTGKVTWAGRKPKGHLVHHLPSDLQDVLLVYCPGDGQMPQVQRVRLWKSGQPLQIDEPPLKPLVVEPAGFFDKEPANRLWAGHLGDLIRGREWQDPSPPAHHSPHYPGSSSSGNPSSKTLSNDRQVSALELLSFHGTLPPPDVADLGYPGPVHLDRSLAAELDLTRWLSLRRLIVLGHAPPPPSSPLSSPPSFLSASSSAIPLQIGGQPVEGRCWVMVRWILPLE